MNDEKKEDKNENVYNVPTPKIATEKDLAMDFVIEVHKKFDRLIKASILFGSQVKSTATAASDIDIILVVDDASISWDIELVSWYREELAKLIAGNAHKDKLHINTVRLTTWWQDLLYGDPVIINILRYGETLIDIGGFFNPLKALLYQGKIRSTPEAVYAALQRSPNHIARSKIATLNAIEGVYWSMVDASQAALITAGKIPPSPEHIPLMLKSTFVDSGFLNISFVRDMRDVYTLHKGISHGHIKFIKGAEIDLWQEKSEKFLIEMTQIITKILESRNKGPV